jgi:acetyl-CoA carboxylase carboxyltransferase component
MAFGDKREMSIVKTYRTALERLGSLEKRAEIGGGQEAIDGHHEKGRLTARERLDLLFDSAGGRL